MQNSARKNTDASEPVIPDMDDRVSHAQRFLSWTFGTKGGEWVRVATSKPGDRDSFRSWTIKLPNLRGMGASLGVIEELLERGETHNVFICSALFDGEGIKAENVTGGRVVWVDIDPPRLKDKSIDQARMPDHMRWLKGAKRDLRNLGAKIVNSGSPGGVHARVKLSRTVSRDELRAINWLLAQTYKGDSKHSSESLLRLPGTLNHKSDPPTYVGPDIGLVARDAPQAWEPEKLVAKLDPEVSLAGLVKELSTPIIETGDEGEPYDYGSNRYANVRLNIEEVNARFQRGDYGSRYMATKGIVKDCMTAGLSLGHAIYAAQHCEPLLDKAAEEYGYTIARDVSRVWVKESNGRRVAREKARQLTEDSDTTPESPESAAPVVRPATVPRFPLDALTGDLRRYVLAVAKSYQVPPEYVAGMCYVAISVATSRAYRVHKSADWTESLVIWFMFLAGPSTRKSPAMDEVMRPIRKEEERRRELHHQTAFIRNRQGKIAKKMLEDMEKGGTGGGVTLNPSGELSEADRKFIAQLEADVREANKPAPTMIASDATIQQLGADMAANGGMMAVIDDESVYLRNLAGLYSGGKTEVSGANKAYQEGSWEISRRGGSLTVRKAFMPTCIAAQPDVVSEIVAKSPTLISSGFMARFLLCMPAPRKKGDYNARQEYDVPRELKTWWNQTLIRIMRDAEQVQAGGRQKRIKMGREAKEVFADFLDHVHNGLMFEPHYSHTQDNLGKLPGVALRLAGQAAVLDGESEITRDNMQRAVKVAEYFAAQAARVLSYFQANGVRKAVAAQLPEVQNEWVVKIAALARKRAALRKDAFTKSQFHQAIKRHLRGTPYLRAETFYQEMWPLLEDADVVQLVNEDGRVPKYDLKGA
ncbi:DUF3987 domain-containing protein [Streptomyces griseoflavus]|uniref:DUF3987 domain-containing protein n=1 Tax=Streptomyces griseoflavus Tu4000 TaxID=467200 RepID=D9XY15_9ACTN|nr:DUF3987 domain-containing protein [Streptomyces griseoflavus]EFL41115.1 hypothetical protein SSRG_03919 [Streptomyces griseoflavus Tu4000]